MFATLTHTRHNQSYKAKKKMLFLGKFASQWKVCSDQCPSVSFHSYNKSITTKQVFTEFDVWELRETFLRNFPRV
jgi:hypothetical protein